MMLPGAILIFTVNVYLSVDFCIVSVFFKARIPPVYSEQSER